MMSDFCPVCLCALFKLVTVLDAVPIHGEVMFSPSYVKNN